MIFILKSSINEWNSLKYLEKGQKLPKYPLFEPKPQILGKSQLPMSAPLLYPWSKTYFSNLAVNLRGGRWVTWVVVFKDFRKLVCLDHRNFGYNSRNLHVYYIFELQFCQICQKSIFLKMLPMKKLRLRKLVFWMVQNHPSLLWQVTAIATLMANNGFGKQWVVFRRLLLAKNTVDAHYPLLHY